MSIVIKYSLNPLSILNQNPCQQSTLSRQIGEENAMHHQKQKLKKTIPIFFFFSPHFNSHFLWASWSGFVYLRSNPDTEIGFLLIALCLFFCLDWNNAFVTFPLRGMDFDALVSGESVSSLFFIVLIWIFDSVGFPHGNGRLDVYWAKCISFCGESAGGSFYWILICAWRIYLFLYSSLSFELIRFFLLENGWIMQLG